jgi:hypothetical protein
MTNGKDFSNRTLRLEKEMASANLLVVKDKVQRYAKQFFNVIQIDDDGDLRIPFESTHVVISVFEMNTSDPDVLAFHKENDISKTIVNLFAYVLWGVKTTPELFKWVATEGQDFDFGAFRVIIDPENSKNCNVQFQYRLAGDTLDPGELKNALAAVAFVADAQDDQLQAKFGGKRSSDL